MKKIPDPRDLVREWHERGENYSYVEGTKLPLFSSIDAVHMIAEYSEKLSEFIEENVTVTQTIEEGAVDIVVDKRLFSNIVNDLQQFKY